MGCVSSVPDVDEDAQKQTSQEKLKSEERDQPSDLPSSPASSTSNGKVKITSSTKRTRLESLSDVIVETKMTLIPQISQTVPQFFFCDEENNSKKYLNEKLAILLAFGFCRQNSLLFSDYCKNDSNDYNHRNLSNNDYRNNNSDRYKIAKMLKRYLYNDTCIVRSLSDHSIKSLLLDPLFIKRKNQANTRKIYIQLKENHCNDKTWTQSGYRIELGVIGILKDNLDSVDEFMRYIVKKFHRSNNALSTFFKDITTKLEKKLESDYDTDTVITPAGKTGLNAADKAAQFKEEQKQYENSQARRKIKNGKKRDKTSKYFHDVDDFDVYYLNMYHWNYLPRYFCYFGKNEHATYLPLYNHTRFDKTYCLKTNDSITMIIEENEKLYFLKNDKYLIGKETNNSIEFNHGFITLKKDKFEYFMVIAMCGCDCNDDGGFVFKIRPISNNSNENEQWFD